MKFFIAFAALAAVAVAVPVQRDLISPGIAGAAPVVDDSGSHIAIGPAILEPAIVETNPISVGPAIVDVTSPVSVGPAIVDVTSPISVGPAIVETNPISVGPAIVDFPLPDGGTVIAEPAVVNPSPVVEPSPVVIGDITAGATPLVQIIVNVQSQQESAVVAPAPAVVEEVYQPGPVNVVDGVSIVDSVVSPIQVVEPVAPGPVNVVDSAPVVIEPVQVVEPIIVEPVQVDTPSAPVPIVPVPIPEIIN